MSQLVGPREGPFGRALDRAEEAERARDAWKANHDEQVRRKQVAQAMVEELRAALKAWLEYEGESHALAEQTRRVLDA